MAQQTVVGHQEAAATSGATVEGRTQTIRQPRVLLQALGHEVRSNLMLQILERWKQASIVAVRRGCRPIPALIHLRQPFHRNLVCVVPVSEADDKSCYTVHVRNLPNRANCTRVVGNRAGCCLAEMCWPKTHLAPKSRPNMSADDDTTIQIAAGDGELDVVKAMVAAGVNGA